MEGKVATVSIEEARRILKAFTLTGRSLTGDIKDVYKAINKYLEIYPTESNRSTFLDLLSKMGTEGSSSSSTSIKENDLPFFILDDVTIRIKTNNPEVLNKLLKRIKEEEQGKENNLLSKEEEKDFDGEKKIQEIQINKENYLSLQEWQRNMITGKFGNDLSSTQLVSSTFGIKKLKAALNRHDYNKAENINVAGKRIQHNFSHMAKEQKKESILRLRFIAAQREALHNH